MSFLGKIVGVSSGSHCSIEPTPLQSLITKARSLPTLLQYEPQPGDQPRAAWGYALSVFSLSAAYLLEILGAPIEVVLPSLTTSLALQGALVYLDSRQRQADH